MKASERPPLDIRDWPCDPFHLCSIAWTNWLTLYRPDWEYPLGDKGYPDVILSYVFQEGERGPVAQEQFNIIVGTWSNVGRIKASSFGNGLRRQKTHTDFRISLGMMNMKTS